MSVLELFKAEPIAQTFNEHVSGSASYRSPDSSDSSRTRRSAIVCWRRCGSEASQPRRRKPRIRCSPACVWRLCRNTSMRLTQCVTEIADELPSGVVRRTDDPVVFTEDG